MRPKALLSNYKSETLRRSGRRFLAALETFPAKHRSSLSRLEWDRCLFTAIRADGSSFNFRIVRVRRQSKRRRALALTGFATLGLILKLLVVEEKLFPGRENEILSAINALQNPVLEFHPSAP